MCQFLIVMLLNLTRIIRVSCTFPLQSYLFFLVNPRFIGLCSLNNFNNMTLITYSYICVVLVNCPETAFELILLDVWRKQFNKRCSQGICLQTGCVSG